MDFERTRQPISERATEWVGRRLKSTCATAEHVKRHAQWPTTSGGEITRSTCYTAAMRVLFVCTANKLRSPTAEDVFRDWPGIEAISAGTDPEAPRPLTKELVASADIVFAMETHHRERIRRKFKQRPPDHRIITLHIPDEFERGDPELVALLREKVEPRFRNFAISD